MTDSPRRPQRRPKPARTSPPGNPDKGRAEKVRVKKSKNCRDEIECRISDDPSRSCKKPSKPGTTGEADDSEARKKLPERISQAEISRVMNKVTGRVRACGSRHGGKGLVPLRLKVAPKGTVSQVEVKSAPNAGNCAANAAKRAKFAQSQKGARFKFPFVF